MDTLRTALMTTAVDLGVPGPDNIYGAGRVNALAAGTELRVNVFAVIQIINFILLDD